MNIVELVVIETMGYYSNKEYHWVRVALGCHSNTWLSHQHRGVATSTYVSSDEHNSLHNNINILTTIQLLS
ncbi:hypothetical protein T552_04067 [Pneumocystis carinii B80]|uniref:Uncharacterized protein n=1 Tax=Pneumocystis carinii (strain B80) TaxID=1408658 RepID=A0A0W4ZQL6_PNEC8|nr:hypothetical protein T552_04067 [Pneumocystis carinii B80]KTW30670.1 hypothetical protein T552_04067 [Pneumocystis carinii B80]